MNLQASPESIWLRVRDHLRPPPDVPLSDWIEANIRLPMGLASEPGKIHLWPWQRGIANAVAENERVTVCKSARVGYTALLTAITANYCVNQPCAILAVLPTESDARDHVVSELENTFDASPVLRGVLGEPGRGEKRSRRCPGGGWDSSAVPAEDIGSSRCSRLD